MARYKFTSLYPQGCCASARSKKEHIATVKASIKKSRQKIDSWNPTPSELRKYKEQAARAKRTGGEYRGNAYDRKRSRQQLVNEFGDGEHCRCWMCGRVLTPDNVTRDKIVVGAQGGRYTQDNLLPACGRCNDSRNDKPVLPALRATLRALGG